MKKNQKNNNNGFTLLELMISMAIGVVVLAALISSFVLQRDRYDVQEQIKNMASTARAAMDIISRDVASAGYSPSGVLQNNVYPKSGSSDNPANADFAGIPYNANMLEIISDLNGSKYTNNDGEWIRYRYNAATKQIQKAIAPINPPAFSGGIEDHEWFPFAENVEAFTFEYLKADGTTPVTSVSEQNLIRTVRLTITAQSEKPDKNSGYKSTTLASDVKVRNLGLTRPTTSNPIAEGTPPPSTPPPTPPTGEEETPIEEPLLPEGFVEKEVALTQDEQPTDPESPEPPVDEEDLPTDCMVKVAVGTCITANNKGDVLLRVRVLDHVTFEPIDGAVVTWSVRDLNSNPVKVYNYGELFSFGSYPEAFPEGTGWYGGQSACSCSTADVDLLCASTNPLNLPVDVVPAWFKDRYFDVIVNIDLEGCGGGQVVVTSDEISDAL